MPVSPHLITVTLNDTDNTTKVANARVYLRNCTKKTSSAEAITNASGVAIIDLANLPLASGQTAQYDVGDKILIIAYKGNLHDSALYTVAGSSKAQTLNLTYVRHIAGETEDKIGGLICANTNGSNPYNAKAYAVEDGEVLAYIQLPANVTLVVPVKMRGSKGIVVERSNTAVVVTAIKN